jgi:hypothetical protein
MIKRITFFPVDVKGAMRSTVNMYWLTAISEEEAQRLDAKWQKKITSIGEMWVTTRKDKKSGLMKQFARKSPPNYERQRKYLIAQYEATKAIQDYANSIDFTMPEDDFAIVCYIPMPKSWTKKKRLELDMQRHKSTPDADNAFKKFADDIFNNKSRSDRFRNDKCISSFAVAKVWVMDESKKGIKVTEYESGYFDKVLFNI